MTGAAMRIVLFGATGGLGGQVLAEARGRGHAVKAMVGDAGDPETVAVALGGQEAVISCLGPGAGLACILAGMRGSGPRRIVAVAGAGILQADEATLLCDAPGFPPELRATAAEHLRAYELLRASAVRWTLVCAPTLDDGEGSGGYRAERDYLPAGGERIARADAALFVLDELESGAFIGSRAGVAE